MREIERHTSRPMRGAKNIFPRNKSEKAKRIVANKQSVLKWNRKMFQGVGFPSNTISTRDASYYAAMFLPLHLLLQRSAQPSSVFLSFLNIYDNCFRHKTSSFSSSSNLFPHLFILPSSPPLLFGMGNEKSSGSSASSSSFFRVCVGVWKRERNRKATFNCRCGTKKQVNLGTKLCCSPLACHEMNKVSSAIYSSHFHGNNAAQWSHHHPVAQTPWKRGQKCVYKSMFDSINGSLFSLVSKEKSARNGSPF